MAAGANPISLGVVPDEAHIVAQKMSEGLKKADVVINADQPINQIAQDILEVINNE